MHATPPERAAAETHPLPGDLAVAPVANLPAVVATTGRRRRQLWLLSLVAVAAAALGTAYWWSHRVPPLPAGIAYGNGRLEADPIDIATKFAGRIAALLVDEGDMVRAGQPLAVMDTRGLQQSLEKALAEVELQQKAISEAEALLEQVRTQVRLAEQQMDRASTLLKNGWTTQEIFDQRSQQLNTARAAERAASARVKQIQNALQAAQHNVELIKVDIADNTLVAPRDGQIQYRVANVGEVLPVGGKVFTLLDVGYVYMDIYLPTVSVGRIAAGDDARILLDAYPAKPLRSRVTFISPQAQFTPKMVETQTERDKLMFRVRVRLDTDQLRGTTRAPSGLPGVAYVRFDRNVQWPAALLAAP
ncbi:MAG: HlyD family efflux transporter periplasmic adaptor subunit [Proteobacteria bacterium]|nr:HlyD family efflux transporter periplasmic adaptor subunit [Pseudomonadota bacterium]